MNTDIRNAGDQGRATPAGGVTLGGQQFHAVTALVYAGLGMILGDWLSGGFPVSKSWAGPLGLLLILGGGALWVVLRRRTVVR